MPLFTYIRVGVRKIDMTEQRKTTFENINDLFKAILWPLIVLIIFFSYKAELNDIIRLIPKKLESSSKISVGSLSFEIEKTARKTGNEELGEIIKNLSEGSIRKLLTLGSGRHSVMIRNDVNEYNKEKSYTLPRDFNILIELEKNGLLKADEPLDQFLSFFKRLKPEEKIWYMSNSGSTSRSRDSTFDEKVVDLTISTSKINSKELERIDRFGIELSEMGKKAFGIIVKVISEQINND
jgi:hypothetical protein